MIRRAIRLFDIAEARAVRNRWWYGWGIRLTPHGWMFNISGLDAVEIEYTNGRKFRIGTDEPNELEEAIMQAIRKAMGGAGQGPAAPDAARDEDS